MKYTKIHTYKDEDGKRSAILDSEVRTGFFGQGRKTEPIKFVARFDLDSSFDPWQRADGKPIGVPLEHTFGMDIGTLIGMNLATLTNGGFIDLADSGDWPQQKSCMDWRRSQERMEEYREYKKNGYRDVEQEADREAPK